jgi:hypothetical protein
MKIIQSASAGRAGTAKMTKLIDTNHDVTHRYIQPLRRGNEMRLSIFAAILLSSPALAQQPQPQSQAPIPVEQRIASQLGNLIIQVTTQSIQIEQLQAALAASQARVKELEAKQEPPK